MVSNKLFSETDLTQMIACHECDLLQRRSRLQVGESACCRRCGAVLYRHKRRSLERALALTLTSLIFYMLTIAFPFMTLEIQGRTQAITLPSGIWQLFDEGLWPLALIVGGMILLAPLAKILGLLYVLLPLQRGRPPRRSAFTYRIVGFLHPWSMMEIYLIGTLVALVKMAELASIILGVAFWSFIALIITETAAGVALDPHSLWERLET